MADRPRLYAGRENLLVDRDPRRRRACDGVDDARSRTRRAREGPERLVVAVPVAAKEACEEIRADVAEVVCLLTPEPFGAIILWYEDFAPTSDEEVHEFLPRSEAALAP